MLYKFHKLLFVSILYTLLGTLLANAAPRILFGSAPSWVIQVNHNEAQPDLNEISDGYYISLYELETNVETDETYSHIIKHIVSDAGVQGASNLSINFNPAYEQLTVNQITVWRNGAPINKLKKDAFKLIANEQDISRFIYNGKYTAYLVLEDIRKGDVLEYDYTIAGSNPIFDKKFYSSYIFQGGDPIPQVHYCIISPTTRKLNFKYFNGAPKVTVKNIAGKDLYEWNIENIKRSESVNNTPSWYIATPFAEVSEYNSWKEVADWAYSINKPHDNLSPAITKRIAAIKEKHGTNKAAIFRDIVAIVQNEVRYMGIELGPYSHKANDPNKVYEQRYGDCKDKSLLLASMLHQVDIPADMALASTTYKDKVTDDLPSPFSFNHAVVRAKVYNAYVWVDPTISYQGGEGTDIYFPYYGKALLLTPQTTELTNIPQAAAGEVRYTETFDVTKVGQPVTLTVYTSYSLSKADNMRNTIASESKRDLEKEFLDYYTQRYPNIEKADSLSITDNTTENTIVTIERYNIPDFFELDSANNNYPMSFYAHMINNQLPTIKTKVNSPLAVSYPYKVYYSIHLVGPLNWNVKEHTETISRNAYHYTTTTSSTSSRLTINHELTFFKDNVAPSELDQYRKDQKKISDKLLASSFTYTPGSTTANYSGVSYIAIFAFLLLLAASIYAAIRIYKIPTKPAPFRVNEPLPIGGWLVLPLLALFAAVARITYFLVSGDFFSAYIWHAYESFEHSTLLTALVGAELVINTVFLVYAVFCLVLFFNKRDILPQAIKVLYIANLVYLTGDSIAVTLLTGNTPLDYKNIFGSVVAVCIWVPYFTVADRVRDTFVVSYPRVGYNIPNYPPVVITTQEAPADDTETSDTDDIASTYNQPDVDGQEPKEENT